MPLIGTHQLVLGRATVKLAGTEAGATLLAHPRHAALGAIAQDLLYLVPDASPGVRATERIGLPILEFFAEVLEPLEGVIERIEEAKEALESGLELVSGGLYGDLVRLSELISANSQLFLLDTLGSEVDLWENLLQPPSPIRNGVREHGWFWGDMVHYRRTGRFVQTLVDRGRMAGDPALRAFGLAAATHIGADAAVHPLVNAIVGGPYRTFPHRHHFVENVLEAAGFAALTGGNVLDLDLAEMFNVTGGALPESALGVIASDDVAMPPSLKSLVLDTLREVYPPGSAPTLIGYPDGVDFDIAYKSLIVFTRFGYQRIPQPSPPALPGIPLDEAVEAVRDLLDALALPPLPVLGPGHLCLSFSCAKHYFRTLAAYVERVGARLGKLIALPLEFVRDLAVYPARFLVYLIGTALYAIYRALRLGLVWLGLTVPYDLDEVTAVDDVYRAIEPMSQGRSLTAAASDEEYPHLDLQAAIRSLLPLPRLPGVIEPFLFKSFHHLPYPFTPGEGAPTESIPIARLRDASNPTIRDVLELQPFDAARVEALVAAASPQETLAQGGGVGNAIDFSAYLIAEAELGRLACHDWNLDADRGNAWRAWTWDFKPPGGPEVDARYLGCPP